MTMNELDWNFSLVGKAHDLLDFVVLANRFVHNNAANLALFAVDHLNDCLGIERLGDAIGVLGARPNADAEW